MPRLVSALGFAAFTVALRWQRIEDSLPASILGAVFAVVAGALAATQLGQPLIVPASDLMWCVLMGVVTMSGGMIFYTFCSRVVPSAELTLLSNTEVLLAPFWVWLIMGETASTATFVGGSRSFSWRSCSTPMRAFSDWRTLEASPWIPG